MRDGLDPAAKDSRMDAVIGWILTIGVSLSALLLAAGPIWRWMRAGHAPLDYSIEGTNLFDFWKAGLREVAARDWRPRLLVNTGIMFLLLTPYVRVAASVVYFACVSRNLKYTVITSIVLAVLTYSLFLR